MNAIFNSVFGDFNLLCDNFSDPQIQAWNQADHYLLNQISLIMQSKELTDLVNKKIAIINDEYGALSIALSQYQPEIYSDSAIFRYWLKQNGSSQSVQNISAISNSSASIFILRLPKNFHYFQHQLSLLSQLQNITILVAGMQKYWPDSFYTTAYDYFDNVNVLDGVKKAKCMILRTGKKNTNPKVSHTIPLPDYGLNLINFPNVFSRDSLDIGTRFFMDNLPDLSTCKNMIDLGCGNGALGIFALKKYPLLNVTFVDESFYAMQSCHESLALNGINENRFTLIFNNSLHDLSLPLVDAIVCNPPFHQQHRIGDHIATTMIEQSFRQLNSGGKLFLIGNRHLPYPIILKNNFSDVKKLTSNNKFIIYEAQK